MTFRTGLKRSTPHRVAHRLGAQLHPGIAATLGQPLRGSAMLTAAAQGDQGESETCAEHSAVACCKCSGAVDFIGSPLTLASCTYSDIRNAVTPPNVDLPELVDTGAELQDVADALRRWGLARLGAQIPGRNGWSDVPDDEPGVAFPEANRAQLEQAGHTLVSGEYAITVDRTAPLLVAASLEAAMPVWLGTLVGPAFQGLSANDVAQPEPQGPGTGGHALYIIGYKTSDGSTAPNPGESQADWLNRVMLVRVKNSWGSEWCDNGECWAGVPWLLACWDLWPWTVPPKADTTTVTVIPPVAA